MEKTSEKVQRTAMHAQKGKTTKKGRTGDTGFATSLRIWEQKHQGGKVSKPKEGGSNVETAM